MNAPESIVLEHAAPTLLLALAGAAALVLVLRTRGAFVAGGRPGRSVTTLRLAFLGVLLAAMLLPSVRRSVEDDTGRLFLVVEDNSASMRPSAENPAGAARAERVKRVLTSPALRRLAERMRVEVVALGTPPGPPRPLRGAVADPGPPADDTPLAEGLRAALTRRREGPPVAALLLSDGLDTREPDSAWAAGPWPCPVHTLRFEEPAGEAAPYVRVIAVATPRRALRGSETRVSAALTGRAKGPVTVRLWRGDTVRESQPVTLPEGGGRREVSFLLPHPTAGTETWAVEAEPIPGERDRRDNRLDFTVETAEGGGRVTYVEAAPRWESKHLVRELQDMGDIRLLALVRGADGRFIAAGEPPSGEDPLGASALRSTRIVILGDLDAATLGAARAAALARFAENGGGLILLGGPAAWGPDGFAKTALAPLLPGGAQAGLLPLSGDFGVRWTAEGLAHPAFAGEAGRMPKPPPLLSVFSGVKPDAASVTLAIAETPAGARPVACARRYGRGSVVAVYTDSLWRWKLRPDEAHTYSRFWRRIVEWMLPESARAAGRTVRLEAPADPVFAGRPAELRVALDSPDGAPPAVRAATLRVTGPDGATSEKPLGGESDASGWRASVEFVPAMPGDYRLTASAETAGGALVSREVLLQARAFTAETDPVPADDALLRTISEASGGTHASERDLPATLDAVDAGVAKSRRLEHTALWRHPLVLGALLATLVGEWLLRRRKRMP